MWTVLEGVELITDESGICHIEIFDYQLSGEQIRAWVEECWKRFGSPKEKPRMWSYERDY
jgi:hypothetical protein